MYLYQPSCTLHRGSATSASNRDSKPVSVLFAAEGRLLHCLSSSPVFRIPLPPTSRTSSFYLVSWRQPIRGRSSADGMHQQIQQIHPANTHTHDRPDHLAYLPTDLPTYLGYCSTLPSCTTVVVPRNVPTSWFSRRPTSWLPACLRAPPPHPARPFVTALDRSRISAT